MEAFDWHKKKEKDKTMTGKKKQQSPLSTILFLIALAVFCVAAYKLITIALEYRAGTKEYESVAADAGMDRQAIPANPEEVSLESLTVPDFAALAEVNPDIVAWIRFQEPSVINYPIVASKDNADYLHHTFEGSYNSAGTLFIDKSSRKDFSDANVIIYGHAMKNKSMFGSLKSYKDEAFFKDNPYFYLFTIGGGVYRYRICAVYETTDQSDAYQLNFADEASFQTYLDWITANSLYDTKTELTTSSHLATLSTCTNVKEDGRLVVQGALDKVYQQESPAWQPYAWQQAPAGQ